MKGGKSTCHPAKTTPFVGSPSTPDGVRILKQRVHLCSSRLSLRELSCSLDELSAARASAGGLTSRMPQRWSSLVTYDSGVPEILNRRLCGTIAVLPPKRSGGLYCWVAEPYSGSGWSEFQMATAQSHEPSGCCRSMNRYLPVALTASGMPSVLDVLE